MISFIIQCNSILLWVFKKLHFHLLSSSSLPLLCLHSSASLLEKWVVNFKISQSDLQTMIYISVDIQFNPILCQALGYAEYIRGEQIHPRTLAVNTAFILQGIQFFCPLNKYFILSWYVESIIFDITCFTSKQQILKVLHMDLLFSSSLPLLCLHSSASLLEKWAGNLKILLSDLQTMIYISVDIQFKDLKFDTHMKDIFVLVVKRFEVVCTSNLETAHNLMSLGWICSPLI